MLFHDMCRINVLFVTLVTFATLANSKVCDSCHLQSLRILSLAKFATLVICKVCESCHLQSSRNPSQSTLSIHAQAPVRGILSPKARSILRNPSQKNIVISCARSSLRNLPQGTSKLFLLQDPDSLRKCNIMACANDMCQDMCRT